MELTPLGQGHHRGGVSRALFSAHRNWGNRHGDVSQGPVRVPTAAATFPEGFLSISWGDTRSSRSIPVLALSPATDCSVLPRFSPAGAAAALSAPRGLAAPGSFCAREFCREGELFPLPCSLAWTVHRRLKQYNSAWRASRSASHFECFHR